MNAFFDTSALVPVFYADHVHHDASILRFIEFDRSSGCCAAHTLVELYSTLTRMPGRHKLSGEQAMLFVGDVMERLSTVTLETAEYSDLLSSSARLGIVGGAVYDAMIARCALKAGAEVLYTWNSRHYALCGAEVTHRVRTP